jgi:hypothetical protein
LSELGDLVRSLPEYSPGDTLRVAR